MAFTVRVIGIYTRGARSSATFEQRRARFLADINTANEAWGSGFFPGVRCDIRFVSGGWYNYANTVIPASTVASIDDTRVNNLIQAVRSARNQEIAIYVVYLSGDTLSTGAIGNGGPRFTFFNNTASYGLVGHVVQTDIAGNPFNRYTFAHEAGHVLFGRFLNASPSSFTINDPSNPGNPHNNNPQNLMFSTAPIRNPFITSAQCLTARRSKVVIENNSRANAKKAKANANAAAVKRLNQLAAKLIRKGASKGNKTRRKQATASPGGAAKKAITRKAIARKANACCKPVISRKPPARNIARGRRTSR